MFSAAVMCVVVAVESASVAVVLDVVPAADLSYVAI